MLNNKDLFLSTLTNNTDDDNNFINDENAKIIFRNYIPVDRSFKFEKCYKTNEVKSTEDKIKANVLKSVKEFLSLEKNNNIIKPVKKDFDLKRNIAQKMEYLNALTIESLKEMSKANEK